MGSCLKGKSEVKKKEAKFTCEKCGAATTKKSEVCKPEKIKAGKGKEKDQDKKKKKSKK